MWQGVKDVYPELWKQADNRLFDNAGFKSLSEYIADAIETFMGIEDYIDVDIYDPESVRNISKMIVSHIDMRFWQAEWKLKSLDTSSGRETIKNDIKVMRQNRKNRKEWSENLALI